MKRRWKSAVPLFIVTFWFVLMAYFNESIAEKGLVPVFTIITGAVLLSAMVLWAHLGRMSRKTIVVSGFLAVFSALSRIPFAGVPSVQPCTFIIMLSGVGLGPYVGLLVGMATPAISNVVLGHGPWTFWQMVGWGGLGLFSGLFCHLSFEGKKKAILVLLPLGGLLFGLVMDLQSLLTFFEPSWASAAAVIGTGLAFNLVHALANLLLGIFFGPSLLFAFERYRTRYQMEKKSP